MIKTDSNSCRRPASLKQSESCSLRLAKGFIAFYSMICHIPISHLDYCAEAKESLRIRELTEKERIELELGFKCAKTHKICLKRYLVSKLIVVLCVFVIMKMLIIIYYQYIYWINLYALELQSAKSELNRSSTYSSLSNIDTHKSWQVDTLNLHKNLNIIWRRLKSIGCPAVHFSIGSNMIYLCLIVLSTTIYLYPVLSSRRFPWGDQLAFLASLFNRKLEIYRVQQMTGGILKQSLNSSRNFAQTQVTLALADETKILDWNSLTSENKLAINHEKLGVGSELKSAIDEHRKIDKMLNSWLRSGKLIPIDREIGWIDRMARLFVIVNATYMTYVAAAELLMLRFLLKNDIELEMDMMDVIASGDVIFLTILTAMIASFHISLFSTIITFRLSYMNLLVKQMAQEVMFLQNSNEFVLGQNKMESNLKLLVTRMNEKLLIVLLRYKIFQQDFKPYKWMLSTIANVTVIVLLVNAVMIRLNLPYLPEEYRVTVCLLITTFVPLINVHLVPMCLMHHAGLELSRHLWSLLAHSRGLNRQVNASGTMRRTSIYYEHTLRMYEKELHDPERLKNQFAVPTIFGSVTFPNLVELYYWFGILTMSTFFEIESWRKILGKRSEDPLNFYGGLDRSGSGNPHSKT